MVLKEMVDVGRSRTPPAPSELRRRRPTSPPSNVHLSIPTCTMATEAHRIPSEDEVEEALLSCRYGEQAEVEAFVASFGVAALADARDASGNNCLHMLAANGHLGSSLLTPL